MTVFIYIVWVVLAKQPSIIGHNFSANVVGFRSFTEQVTKGLMRITRLAEWLIMDTYSDVEGLGSLINDERMNSANAAAHYNSLVC